MKGDVRPRESAWALIHTACLASAFSFLALMAGLAALAAPATGPVLAVFPPWTDAATITARIDRAGGRIVGFGAREWIIAVIGPSPTLRDDLRDQGAILILDPRKIAALCGTST